MNNLISHQFWQNPILRKVGQITCILLLLGITVRSIPYLAPIHTKDLIQDRQAIEFSDRNGLPLGTLLSRNQEHTAVVPLNEVSPHFKNAIIAAEDKGFYQHGALDIKAIARAIHQAIEAKRIVSGASTITMQLARMIDPIPRTFWGKTQEIWLSWRLAAGMTKNEILSAYINRLPMGGNIYGVEAASRVYFGIPASDLNLAQATLLAALPNDPTNLNPYHNLPALKRRQIYVLNRMVKDGYITRANSDRAYTEKIALQPRKQGILAAPQFLFWVANELDKENLKVTHPSHLRTTIDRPLQQFVEAQVQEVVRILTPNNVHHAAALVINNHTGEVLAYVGSPDYFNEAEIGRNDGVQALRQPGSTLKPFLYELALENRIIHPNTVLADVPTHYAIPGAKLYSPQDYNETFQGPVRVRIALANSLNIPAVRVLEKLGVSTFLERLHQLGFSHLNYPPEYYGLGLTLGSGEVSLWELARAYVTMARQGDAIPFVTTFYHPTIQNPTSNSSIQNPKSKIQNPTEWALITDMLSDAHARAKGFGVESVLALPFPAAVKTGTSSNFRDTWTVGFTRDYTVATWVGNFDGDRMAKVSGVMGAAPLWNRIMLHLHEDREPAAFPPPKGLLQKPICAISGLRPTPACPSVVQEYFYPEDISYYESHPDTFYQIVSSDGKSPQYRLNLPAEYNEWLAMQPQPNLAPSGLKILSPRNGDVFLVYPAEQRLQFKLATASNQPIEWWLNGEKVATQSSNSFFWQLRPGNWTLEVQSGEMSDRVSFQVELADNKRIRRGFSVAGH
ncbi:penicillin-binding protein 1C [Argonema antarcticum]|uniref:penicillin-binding protein 1C n=1 Tax=Argonema antarcticum TaxID=2942763 RepID=UPI0020133BB1|nr:penicillin-binding protein 1C [Argonema antarcticum]MCL1473139.1 penicillin-binding protein 1C [Argonema antarcticum A004/B2]